MASSPKAKLAKREFILLHSQKVALCHKSHTQKVYFCGLGFCFQISTLKNKIENLVLFKNHFLVTKIRPGFMVWFLLTKLAVLTTQTGGSYLPKQVALHW
jgi:hypothetical protein